VKDRPGRADELKNCESAPVLRHERPTLFDSLDHYFLPHNVEKQMNNEVASM
jgi:hypothetical protein